MKRLSTRRGSEIVSYRLVTVITILLLILGTFSAIMVEPGLQSSAGHAIPTGEDATLVSHNGSDGPSQGRYEMGMSIFALNASYYSSFPVNSPYLSYRNYEIGQSDRGFGALTTPDKTSAIKFMVYISQMYPAHIHNNLSGGLQPNYSLQSDFFVNGSGSGGMGLYWIQFGVNFQYAGTSDNMNLFWPTPFLEWWWPGFHHTEYTPIYIPTNDTVSIGSSSPLMVEGWEFAGRNASGNYVNVSLMYNGNIRAVPWGGSSSASFSHSTAWFNTTYYFGNGSGMIPAFQLMPRNYGNQGLGIVGFANGQSVWANITYSSIIEEVANGSFELPQVSRIVGNFSGETAVGLHAEMVVNQSSNPFGLPDYTPYAYFTNGSLPGNASHELAYFPMVIQGFVYPFNSSITAYSPTLHRNIPVDVIGDAFLVSTIGHDITPLVLNVTSPGFKNYSVTYYPAAVNVSEGVELHSPFISLVPLSGGRAYGYVELPFPYLAYLMDGYIYSNGGPKESMNFWDSVASAWREWFPLKVSAGTATENLSWYYPYLFHEYSSIIFNASHISPHAVIQPFDIQIEKLYLNSPVYIPYSFDINGNASIKIISTFLNQSFSLPAGGGEYNITPSMVTFQIPAVIDDVANWYEIPYAIGEVVWNGKVVWAGDSAEALFTFPYSITSNIDSFQTINATSSGSSALNFSSLDYSASAVVYPFNGSGVERLSVTIPLFNYSVAMLVSSAFKNETTFPVHFEVRLGGDLYLPYFIAAGSIIFLIGVGVALISRKKGVRQR